MRRFLFLRAFILLLLALPAAAAPRPNIIVILADDLGWRDVGFMGSPFYETPNLDRLALDGLVFTSAYAAAPVCSPTRASLLTGRYPAALHQTDWIPGMGDEPGRLLLQVQDLNLLPHEETTIAEVLRAEGYSTGHIGKWHLGGEGHLPTDQGFDINIAGNHRGSPPGYFWPYRRGEYHLPELAATGHEGEYLTERLADEAVQFIEEHRDEPFFLYLSHYTVHTPLQAPEEDAAPYKAKAEASSISESAAVRLEDGLRIRQHQRDPVYAAMVEHLDRSVGRVLDALDEFGLTDSTVVVFYSDNGGLAVLPEARRIPPTSNAPLRAGKGWLYEGGIRIPCVIRWPDVITPGATSEVPISSIDLLPTLLDAAGATLPPNIDGVSLVPLLRGAGLDRDALYWHYPHYHGSGARPSGAVREGDYKLIEWFEDGRIELYNLARDPGEKRDLARLMPEKTAALRNRLAEWRRRVDAQMPRPGPDNESR